jgi:hypothetical protein
MALPSQRMNVTSSRGATGAPGAAQERRISLRYPLHAETVFAWDDEFGQHRERRGHTRDVGRTGAFVLASECPPNGSRVALSVFLPASNGETGTLRIEAQGCVVRAESGSEVEAETGPGFAVSHQSVNLFSK